MERNRVVNFRIHLMLVRWQSLGGQLVEKTVCRQLLYFSTVVGKSVNYVFSLIPGTGFQVFAVCVSGGSSNGSVANFSAKFKPSLEDELSSTCLP